MLDYSIQPYQGTDLVAFVLATLAVLCVALWRRDEEPGMGWFALSLGALATWIGFNHLHLPTGPQLDPSPWFYLMCLAMGSMALGLVRYLDVPPRWRRWVLVFALAPAAGFAAIVALVSLTGVSVLRLWVHILTALSFTAMGVLALWAARREPGAGHAWVGCALLSVPALALAMMVARADPVALRYWVVLPVVLLGLTLPTVSLLRRRRALEAEVARRKTAERDLAALNASLEDRVAQRTADLQHLVLGLESFNRSVSHDLRGPLGGIAGLARLADDALRRGDASVAQRVMPVIAGQAESSTRLVSTLLTLAHVGDAALRRQPVDLGRLAQEVIDEMAAGARLLPAIDLRALPVVDADPDLLRPVFMNLVGNAAKFTSERGGAGRIEIGASQLAGETQVFVRDNGVGFDADTARALFQPFVRLHGGRFEGHGIGLSIVRRAVERHGGRVWADARPGAGATFHFSLPG